MTSLASLSLEGVKLDDKEEWDHPSSVVDMKLLSCSLFFQPRALALWVCYGQIYVFEILLGFDDSLTSIYHSCVLHGCLGISTSPLLALSFEHFSLEFSYTH